MKNRNTKKITAEDRIKYRHDKLLFLEEKNSNNMNSRDFQRIYNVKKVSNQDDIKYHKNELVDVEDEDNYLSIIITAYRTENYIEECLNSIENQTYFKNNDKYEILLGVDGCENTLNTVKKIRHKYRNLRIFSMKENVGTYVTSNTLLDYAKFDNIIRFDSDDVMMPEMIAEIMKVRKTHNVVRFYFYNFYYENEARKEQLIKYFAKGCLFFKREIIDFVGGYMPWECSADNDLLNRAASIIKEKSIEKPLFYRRIHDNNLIKIYGLNSEVRKKNDDLSAKNIEIKIIPKTSECVEILNIPRKMYFYWSGNKMSWIRYMTFFSFKKYNPDWEVILILNKADDYNNTKFKHSYNQYSGHDYLDKLKDFGVKIENVSFLDGDLNRLNELSPVQKSDLIRYYYLYKYGGFYCDTDVIFIKPIDDFYDKVVSGNFNTVLHEHGKNLMTIGFIASSPDNQIFRDLYEYGLNNLKNLTNQQSFGVLMIYEMINRLIKIENKSNIEKLRLKYLQNRIMNIPTNLMYQHDWRVGGNCFELDEYGKFDLNAIGCHWFGGHPTSQKYEQLLNHENYKNYNNTFCNYVKNIYKEN